MARVFARLKLSLLGNTLRRGSTGIRVLYAFSVVFGCGIALLTGAALAAIQNPEVKVALAVFTFTLTALGWLVLPLLGLGGDGTLDPLHFVVFPLSAREVQKGQFVASLIGIAPWASLLAFAGAAVGSAQSAVGYTIASLAVIVQLLLCISLSRASTTGLSAMLRSRRGKDVTTVVVIVLGATAAFTTQFAIRAITDLVADGETAITGILQWTPPGALARAAARPDDTAVAAASLVYGAVALIAAWTAWRVALDRAGRNAVPDVASSSQRRRRANLVPWFARWIPGGRMSAAAGRELRYVWRSPRRRAGLLLNASIGIGILVYLVAAGGEAVGPKAVLLMAPFAGTLLSLASLNQIGEDGKAVVLNILANGDVRKDVEGRNLADLHLVVGVTTLAALGLAVATGGWAYVPAAIVTGTAVGLVSFGVGNVVSSRAPIPMPDSANVFANRGATVGCSTSLMPIVGMALIAVLLIPIFIAVVVAILLGSTWAWSAIILTFAYGIASWMLGTKIAARRLERFAPEVLATLDL